MGACASKSMALKEGEAAPVTLEAPAEISKVSEAVQEQEEVKHVAEEVEDGENSCKSLGVLMSQVEHPEHEIKHIATTAEDVKMIAEVENTEEDQPKAVNPVEKSAVIAEESAENVESEAGTLLAGLSATKKEQAEQDQSIDKVEELDASPPQIPQDEVEEQSVELGDTSAIIAEQYEEKVESKTGSTIAEISETEKAESEIWSAVAEISKSVIGQSERDQLVDKAEVDGPPVSAVDKFVSDTEIAGFEQSEQEQALEKMERKEGVKWGAEEPVDKFESRTESVISEASITALEQQPLKTTELEREEEEAQISQKQAAIPEGKFEPKDEKPIAETARAIAVELEDQRTSESKSLSLGE